MYPPSSNDPPLLTKVGATWLLLSQMAPGFHRQHVPHTHSSCSNSIVCCSEPGTSGHLRVSWPVGCSQQPKRTVRPRQTDEANQPARTQTQTQTHSLSYLLLLVVIACIESVSCRSHYKYTGSLTHHKPQSNLNRPQKNNNKTKPKERLLRQTATKQHANSRRGLQTRAIKNKHNKIAHGMGVWGKFVVLVFLFFFFLFPSSCCVVSTVQCRMPQRCSVTPA